MALIKLYEAASPSVLYGAETMAWTRGSWYTKRHDCVIHNNGSLASTYKIYRDGTVIRACAGDGLPVGYDTDYDLHFSMNYGATNYFNDPIGLRFDPSKPATVTVNTIGSENGVARQQVYYRASGNTALKYSYAGVAQGSITVTGTVSPFSADTLAITDDGTLVLLDYDNGTYGVARFYNLLAGVVLHESVFDRSRKAWVDTAHNNIWSLNLSTGRMQVWSFLVAPSSFSAITMGANRCRYREDALSVTLRGSLLEPVPNWPVSWSLSTGEGHLQESFTLTDSAGVATNVYCGPGATDYVGGSQTITVSTGY
jgi:hypothetical protein